MKFEKFGPYLGWGAAGIGLLSTIAGGAYWVATETGLVVNKAQAAELIEQKAAQVYQAVVDEAEARERADLKLQLENAIERAKVLDERPNKSIIEKIELDAALDEIKRILARQAELDK